MLNIPPQFAWIMVWFSLLVVGPAEEYLFRGFTYGGNLLVPAVTHGAYDATAFIGVATSESFGLQLRGIMVLVGIVVALLLFLQKTQQRKPAAL